MSDLKHHAKTWLDHFAITAAWGLPGFVAGGSAWAIACALGYFFREVDQHRRHGTKGVLQWIDRIMDVVTPVTTALLYALFLPA